MFDRAVQSCQGSLQSWRLTPAPLRGEILLSRRYSETKEGGIGKPPYKRYGKVISEARGDVTGSHRHGLLHGR